MPCSMTKVSLTGLSSGVGIDSSDFSLFSLNIDLTPKGMEQKDRVLNLTFQWIALIRDGFGR
jgi:secreted Zn-dependent insulinase-like peptidase